jgi:hypothetical protein
MPGGDSETLSQDCNSLSAYIKAYLFTTDFLTKKIQVRNIKKRAPMAVIDKISNWVMLNRLKNGAFKVNRFALKRSKTIEIADKKIPISFNPSRLRWKP